jgi:hypothetical protein
MFAKQFTCFRRWDGAFKIALVIILISGVRFLVSRCFPQDTSADGFSARLFSQPLPLAPAGAVTDCGSLSLRELRRWMSTSAIMFGWAWLVATLAFTLHVIDEATYDFLAWYNLQALRIRRFLGGFPFPPTFTFWPWLTGLSLAVLVLAALTPAAYAGSSWLRPLGVIMGVEHVGSGLLHLGAGLVTRRAVPGIWSAPILLATGVWLLLATFRL